MNMNILNLKKCIKQGVENKRFGNVAVAIKRDDELIETFGGDTDRFTYFDVASCGKVLVTAPLIFKALGERKLTLDTKIGKFFDKSFFSEDCAIKESITIQQLLTHTSGIERNYIPKEIGAKGRDAVIKHILAEPLAFSPSTEVRYSCNGTILLGYIAELIYGLTLDKLFEKFIKTPLSLERSRFNIAIDEPNAAECFERKDVGNLRVDDCNVYNMGGIAGSGASFWCIADIEKFADGIMSKSDAVFASEIYRLSERDYTSGCIRNEYFDDRGLGWQIVNESNINVGNLFPADGTTFGHTGWTGVSLFFNRRMNMYVIILTNATRYNNIRNNFQGFDFMDTYRVRRDLHNAILSDSKAWNL